MGYTPFSKLNIRKYKNRKNPVVNITIPFNLIKELKWKDEDVIMLQKYKTDLTSSIDMINLNRSSKEYFKPMLWEIPSVLEKIKNNRLKVFNQFPKSKTKELLEGWYYKKKYEKKDKKNVKKLEKKKAEIEMNMKDKELNHLRKEESELSTEILHITNRFPYLKLKLREIQEQIKQRSSS